jgi:predicted kinase
MKIIVLVGLPGSGKSTWLERRGGGGLSSDAIRGLLTDDEDNQTVNARVFETLRFLLRQRLAIGREATYIDATNLTRPERAPYIRVGAERGCDVEAVYFDTPLETCLERNAARRRVVPEEKLRAMARKLQPPCAEEGFTRVTVVSAPRL